MKYIRLSNGSLHFVGNGLPPMEVPGYTVDAGDSSLFHPNWIECQHREIKMIRLPNCNRIKPVECCNKYNIPAIVRETCQNCIAVDKVKID